MPNSPRETPEFDRYAPAYAELLDDPIRNRFARDPLHFHRRKWALLQSLLARAGTAPKSLRWLDVGCGQGELLSIAGSAFASAVGCDPAANMLPPSARFETRLQPSLETLPFENASVDFVTAVCVFHHVNGIADGSLPGVQAAQPARALLTAEIRRVLSPGGLCCIVEHNPWNPVTQTIVKRCAVDVDAQLLSAQETQTMLTTSGFRHLSTDFFLYLPESLHAKFGALEKLVSRLPMGGQYAVLAQSST